jgi:hypothetical protein
MLSKQNLCCRRIGHSVVYPVPVPACLSFQISGVPVTNNYQVSPQQMMIFDDILRSV